jgi:hypothetical protein
LQRQFRAHHKVFLLLLQVLQPQLYLGAHQQVTAAQPLLLIVFTGLVVQLLPEALLLELLDLPQALRTLSRFTRLTLPVLGRAQQVILLLLNKLGDVSYTAALELTLGTFRLELLARPLLLLGRVAMRVALLHT